MHYSMKLRENRDGYKLRKAIKEAVLNFIDSVAWYICDFLTLICDLLGIKV